MRKKDNIPTGCMIPLVGLAFLVMIAMEAPFLLVIGAVIFIIASIGKTIEKKEKEKQDANELYNALYSNMFKDNLYQKNENIIEKIDYMNGQEFEKFLMQEILPKDGYINIQGTNYTGDYGVDIIAFKNDIKCAIQCKRANSKISNSAIQEVATGRKHYKCEKAIVITNNYYTENAKQLAFDNKVELLDRDYLIKMIKK